MAVSQSRSGGSGIYTSPSLIAVGEVGPEEVFVRPLANGGPMGGGPQINISGPAIFDGISMNRFINSIETAMRRNSNRYG
jgi:hypothetical protein